jgi:F-type H+-transporting ATPase subunit delta
MGSATRQARAAAKLALTALAGSAGFASTGLQVGEELFAAGEAIGGSKQLRRVLVDPSASEREKKAVIASVFGSRLSAPVTGLLASLVQQRWSDPADLLSGLEELGLRAIAESADAGTDIEAELFAFAEVVSSDPQLELAVGGRLGDPEAKSGLVGRLLAKTGSPQTIAIVRHLVRQPRGRRIGPLLAQAASIVADQAGMHVATVTTAVPLSAAQLERLRERLSAGYGRQLLVNQVVDTTVLGGVRVQVGDDIIDGSVLSRLNELRLRLAS